MSGSIWFCGFHFAHHDIPGTDLRHLLCAAAQFVDKLARFMAFPLESSRTRMTFAPTPRGLTVHDREILAGYVCRPRRQLRAESTPMGLFTADLYRSFAIGFGLGALVLAITVASQLLTPA
jgi:hypothetical protein